jgi:hypothetical protein
MVTHDREAPLTLHVFIAAIMDDRNNKSPQILNSASNFLGFCFLVLTSLKFLKLSATTFIDEITSVCFVVFMFSCLCAFLSIRSRKMRNSVLYEVLAEYSFLIGLLIIFLMTIFFMLEIIH